MWRFVIAEKVVGIESGTEREADISHTHFMVRTALVPVKWLYAMFKIRREVIAVIDDVGTPVKSL